MATESGTPQTIVFSLEKALNSLYEVVYSPGSYKYHPSGRFLKPALVESLGVLAGVENRRRFWNDREYYKVEMLDFFDFATSPLCTAPKLSDYKQGVIRLYESFDRTPAMPLLELGESRYGISIADGALARDKMFVSVTVRLIRHERAADGRGWVNDCDWEQKNNWLMITLMLAPDPQDLSDASFPFSESALNAARLIEWGRCIVFPPLPHDQEWRFCSRGVFADHLIELAETRRNDRFLTPKIIDQLKRDRLELDHCAVDETELARVCFHLPAYCRFMYDLVTTEKVPVRRATEPKNPIPMKSANAPGEVVYRTIKSIRVIREPASETDSQSPTRSWTPPTYRYAVRGHWRTYNNAAVRGHDPIGNIILGKTWIKDYYKGFANDGELNTRTTQPPTIIHVKQTLAYGRAVTLAQSGVGRTTSVERYPEHGGRSIEVSQEASSPTTSSEKPPVEWRARERAKLTAGLRFLIMQRDGYRCRLCGRSQADQPGVHLEVDHIRPVSNWGMTEEPNLWTLCRDCNKGKSAQKMH